MLSVLHAMMSNHAIDAILIEHAVAQAKTSYGRVGGTNNVLKFFAYQKNWEQKQVSIKSF